MNKIEEITYYTNVFSVLEIIRALLKGQREGALFNDKKHLVETLMILTGADVLQCTMVVELVWDEIVAGDLLRTTSHFEPNCHCFRCYYG